MISFDCFAKMCIWPWNIIFCLPIVPYFILKMLNIWSQLMIKIGLSYCSRVSCAAFYLSKLFGTPDWNPNILVRGSLKTTLFVLPSCHIFCVLDKYWPWCPSNIDHQQQLHMCSMCDILCSLTLFVFFLYSCILYENQNNLGPNIMKWSKDIWSWSIKMIK